MQVVENFKQAGPQTDIDINNVMMRYTMDVTGLVGFAKDYQCCVHMDDAKTDDFFDVLRSGDLPWRYVSLWLLICGCLRYYWRWVWWVCMVARGGTQRRRRPGGGGGS